MPGFRLPDGADRELGSDDLDDSPVLVAFICNHCPYVQPIAPAFSAFAREYLERGLAMVASTAMTGAPIRTKARKKMAAEARKHDYPFPYLVDKSQDVARAFGAACTPDFFLFDRGHRLAGCGKNPLRAQRDLKRPAAVLCCDGQSGSLSERQSAAAGRFRPCPVGLSGWPARIVTLFRRADARALTRW